jgi:hypothetical protein
MYSNLAKWHEMNPRSPQFSPHPKHRFLTSDAGRIPEVFSSIEIAVWVIAVSDRHREHDDDPARPLLDTFQIPGRRMPREAQPFRRLPTTFGPPRFAL